MLVSEGSLHLASATKILWKRPNGPRLLKQTRENYLAAHTLPAQDLVRAHRDKLRNTVLTRPRAMHGDLAGLLSDSKTGA